MGKSLSGNRKKIGRPDVIRFCTRGEDLNERCSRDSFSRLGSGPREIVDGFSRLDVVPGRGVGGPVLELFRKRGESIARLLRTRRSRRVGLLKWKQTKEKLSGGGAVPPQNTLEKHKDNFNIDRPWLTT